MRKIAVAIAAVFALSLTACGNDSSSTPAPAQVTVTATPTPTPTPTPQAPAPSSPAPATDVFLQVLRKNTDGWDNADDSKIVSLANSICKGWEADLTLNQMGSILVKGGYSVHDAGFFIGAATETYCPKFGSRINGSGSNA